MKPYFGEVAHKVKVLILQSKNTKQRSYIRSCIIIYNIELDY